MLITVSGNVHWVGILRKLLCLILYTCDCTELTAYSTEMSACVHKKDLLQESTYNFIYNCPKLQKNPTAHQ
jgi:hypothetical protein